MEQGQTDRMEQGYSGSQSSGPGAGAGGAISLNDDNRRDAWWNIRLEAFNLFHPPDQATFLRRLCAFCIMGMRSWTSFLQAAWDLFSFRPVLFLFTVALGIVGFFLAAWGLAIIVEVKGRPVVFGRAIERRHLDIFLLVTALIHGPMILLFVSPYGLGARIFGIVMCLLIDAVAWVCTWPAEGEVYV